MADHDAIVIGSGAGGMSAALEILRSGHSVLLVEAMPEFGGCLHPFQKAGYSFDVGLHYIGELARGERFWESLSRLGLQDKMDFIELNPDAIDRYVFPDLEVRLCKGTKRFQEQLVDLFPKEEPGIVRFFKIYEKVTQATKTFLDVDVRFFDILGWLIRNPIMMKYSRVPYQVLMDETTSDIRLQAALAAPWFDYMLPPEKASVTYGIGTLNHYLEGAYYPRGGSGAFRDVFLDSLKKDGAALEKSARIASVSRRGKEFLVNSADGRQWTSKVVVSDVDPVLTLGELVDTKLVPHRIKKKATRLRPSESVFGVMIGTDLDLPSMGITTGNLVHYSDYDINKLFKETMAAESPKVSGCFLINSPSVRDPNGKLVPEGLHSLEILAGASISAFEPWEHLSPGERGPTYESFTKSLGEQLISTSESFIPGLSQHILFLEYLTPLSLQSRVNLVRGGIYGPESTPDQMGLKRFPDGTCGIEGLYLAGAGANGSSVLSCVQSGIRAGSKAVDYMKD